MFGGFDTAVNLKGVSVTLLVALLLVLSLPGIAYDERYPTPYDYNEEKILNPDLWDLFVSVDGFNNTPNAELYTFFPAEVQLNDSSGIVHIVTLTCDRNYSVQKSSYDFVVRYVKVNSSQIEVLDIALSIITGLHRCRDNYYLTMSLDQNQMIHVIWEESQTKEDAPYQYWLYHVGVTTNGTITHSEELFYYESIGSGPPRPGYLWWLCAMSIGFVVMFVGLAIRRWKKRKEP